jgi:hypothetical protein
MRLLNGYYAAQALLPAAYLFVRSLYPGSLAAQPSSYLSSFGLTREADIMGIVLLLITHRVRRAGTVDEAVDTALTYLHLAALALTVRRGRCAGAQGAPLPRHSTQAAACSPRLLVVALPAIAPCL